MLGPKLAAALIVALPLIIVAWIVLWRRMRPVFWFALALIAVATGYLVATGAAEDIASRLVPQISSPQPVRAK